MAGAAVQGQPGVYGTLQTPAAGNIPGARQGEVTWTDHSGNLWLFGGYGYDSAGMAGYLNDLWKFSPGTNQWAWVGGSSKVPQAQGGQAGVYGTLGVPAVANVPGGRSGAAAWADKTGNLWLYGGDGFDASGTQGTLNDLWEFSPSTGEWTWMGGNSLVPGLYEGQPGVYGTPGQPAAGNLPGDRTGAAAWIDKSGNFWLFGGDGEDSTHNSGVFNDLWEFNLSANEWAWMGGNNTVGTPNGLPGTYGKLQTPAAGNLPGGREYAVTWTDSQGNLWLFGGKGYDSAATLGWLNDLWEFQPSINEWAWLGGSSTFTAGEAPGISGLYGTLQTPAAGNIPGSREYAVGATDNLGNLWIFGGYGYDSEGNFGDLNDLWKFNPSTGQWAWMGGSSLSASVDPSPGIYGTLRTPDFGDTPGGRHGAVSWTDSGGNLWVFGGDGYDGMAAYGDLNDLWECQLNTGGLPTAATPVLSPDAGAYSSVQTVTISDATPGASIYYLLEGNNAPATLYTAPIPVSSDETVEAVAVASGYATSNVASATYTVTLPPTAAPAFSPAPGTYSTAQTVSITDATPGVTLYYAINGSATTSSAVYSAPITVSTSETIEALAVASGYRNSSTEAAYTIWPPLSAMGEWTWMGGSGSVPICSLSELYCGPSGVYGTLGTPAAANIPGGRFLPATWTDKRGNFWLFGGLGFDGSGAYNNLSDLWEFNPASNQWTWTGGSSTAAGSVGRPGVYGTVGSPVAANIPGARYAAVTWTDASDNLWLFGGEGVDSTGAFGWLNDLWKFNPSTNEWTWINGNSVLGPNCQPTLPCGQPGVYGTLGESAAANMPGGRSAAVGWTDLSGNLWLFGGTGYDSTGTWGFLNDLWEFSPSTGDWTWMDGSATLLMLYGPSPIYGQIGVYGTLGTPAPTNVPGTRSCAAGWADTSGNFWLFGGHGFDADGFFGFLNDFWDYTLSTNEWTWMGGEEFYGQPGVYGTQGTPAAGNVPGNRCQASYATDSSGNFWLFSGFGSSPFTVVGYPNDLWEFSPSSREWTWVNGDGTSGALGVYGLEGMSAATSLPVGRSGGAGWIDSKGNVWVFGGNAEKAYLNDVWEFHRYTNNLPVAATPAFSVSAGTYSSAQAVTLTDEAPGATIYYSISGGTSVTQYTGAISVSSTETIQAVAEASGYANSGVASATYTIVVPATFSLTESVSALTVSNGGQGTLTLTVTPQNGFSSPVSFACSGLPAEASCSFNPSTVTPSGGVATTQLIISDASATAGLNHGPQPLFPVTALAAVVCLFGWKNRRGLRLMMLLGIGLIGMGGLVSSCSGGGGSGGGGKTVTPEMTTVTVTATAGTLQQTVAFTLSVN